MPDSMLLGCSFRHLTLGRISYSVSLAGIKHVVGLNSQIRFHASTHTFAKVRFVAIYYVSKNEHSLETL